MQQRGQDPGPREEFLNAVDRDESETDWTPLCHTHGKLVYWPQEFSDLSGLKSCLCYFVLEWLFNPSMPFIIWGDLNRAYGVQLSWEADE